MPSTSPVASIQRTRGTGTSLRSPASRIASNWSWSRYDGKTGTSSAAGATRATNSPSRRSPFSVHEASSTRVSDDMPLAAIPVCSLTVGSAPSGRWEASHSASRFGTLAESRLDRCIEKSAGGPWVTSADWWNVF